MNKTKWTNLFRLLKHGKLCLSFTIFERNGINVVKQWVISSKKQSNHEEFLGRIDEDEGS